MRKKCDKVVECRANQAIVQIRVTHPALSVTMHKPTDEYFGRYETFFSSSKIHFLNLNVK